MKNKQSPPSDPAPAPNPNPQIIDITTQENLDALFTLYQTEKFTSLIRQIVEDYEHSPTGIEIHVAQLNKVFFRNPYILIAALRDFDQTTFQKFQYWKIYKTSAPKGYILYAGNIAPTRKAQLGRPPR